MKVRVRVKKHRRKIVEKKRRGPVFAAIFYMAVTSLLVSAMIARCPLQYFIVEANGPQAQKGEEEMQVTIYAGSTSYKYHAMESLTLQHENGTDYSINAKDVDKGMRVWLDGKFRYVIQVRG